MVVINGFTHFKLVPSAPAMFFLMFPVGCYWGQHTAVLSWHITASVSFHCFIHTAVIGYLPSAHLTHKTLDMQW